MNSFSLKYLFVAMVALLCSVAASAHNFEVDGIFYNVTDETNLTVEVTYKGNYSFSYSNEYSGDVVIPSSVSYNGKNYSVTSIGYDAFDDCTSLKDLRIEDGKTTLSIYDFYDCQIETLYLGRNIKYETGYSPFNGNTKLKSVTIGNSVTSIGDYAFQNCSSLTSITIPNSVTSIGEWAFSYCSSLKSVTIPNSVTSIGEGAFDDCTSLKDLRIEDGKTTLSIYEFYDCQIETLYLGRNINYKSGSLYGYSPFNGNTKLKSVTIGNSVTSIGDYAFGWCDGLTSVTIGNSVTSIGNRAFDGCSSLTSVYINDLVAWCNMELGSWSNPLNYAREFYLNGELLRDIVIPKEITEIKNEVFVGYDNLRSVVIHDNVTSIGNYAFQNCSGLTSITIPNSVTSIGQSAFYGCSSLKTVINLSNLNVFKGSSSNGFVGYYAAIVINASNASNVSIEIEGDFVFGKINGDNTLCGYIGNATQLSLPANYNGENYVIGEEAFYGCSGLTSITIPNSVTSIGYYAFMGCSGLTSITIPNSVISIGDYAFEGCSGLTSVTIGNSVTSIGNRAFYSCGSLTSVTIGNSVTSIGEGAFMGCSALTSVYLFNETPINVSRYAFSNYRATLYVPQGSLDAYKAADYWNKFTNIVEFDPTDIEDVTEDVPTFEVTAGAIQFTAAEGKEVAVYTASGALVKIIDSYDGEEITLDKGVYIIRVGDKAVKIKL